MPKGLRGRSSEVGIAAARSLGDRRARPNLVWLHALTGAPERRWRAILRETSQFADIDREIRDRHLAAGRRNYAQFRAPLELYSLVRWLAPDHVVETGVSSGVSSAHLLLALRRNGHGLLHSIDRPTPQRSHRLGADESPVALPPGREVGWAVPEAIRTGWDLRLGPSEEILPRLARQLPSIGLFLHDSRHTARHLTFELETVRPRLLPHSIVLADNTVWTGSAFPQFARRLGARVVRRGHSDLVGLSVPSDVAPSRSRVGVRSRAA
ncbi:MAG: class I SAM-dependent methyltransferase [Thermoplasmata archaeon]